MSEPEHPRGSGDESADPQSRTAWQDEVDEVLRDADLPPPPSEPDDPVADLPPEPTPRELQAMYEIDLGEEELLDLVDSHIEFAMENLRRRTVFEYQETIEAPDLALSALRSVQNLQRLIRNEQTTLRQHGNMHDSKGDPDDTEKARLKLGEMLDPLDILGARIRRLNPAAAREFDAEAEG